MLPAELKNAIASNCISHAYIFTCEAQALEFAQNLGAQSSDFIQIVPQDGKNRLVTEDIENLQQIIKFKPYGQRRVVILHCADTLTQQAQNKLLKTLEEPAEGNTIILLSDNPQSLLSTVLSRCVLVHGQAENSEAKSQTQKLAEDFFNLQQQGACYYQLRDICKALLNEKENQRGLFMDFLESLENIYRNNMLKTAGSGADQLTAILACEDRIRRGLQTSNSFKALCLSLEEK